jgi:hypothetical protein
MSQGESDIYGNHSCRKETMREAFTAKGNKGTALKSVFPVTKWAALTINHNTTRSGNNRMAGRNIPFHCRAKTRIEIRPPFRDETEFQRRASRNTLGNGK